MAVSVIAPLNHVTDANGLPYVGALQYIYNAGTTTLQAVYTDAALTIAAANPQTSDAAGNFARVYTATGTYKIYQTMPDGTTRTYDNIDSGLSAGTTALGIAVGGTGATTASAARANLGAASTSDVTALAAQIATFTSSLTNLVSNPQGRLTPTSGAPVISSSVSAGTALYYTPYTGNLCPVYDGVQFNPRSFSEMTLTLNSSYILNSIYDVFIINDSGNGMTVVTGPAWSTITAGSGARGTGAGTTELTRINGILVNANAMATARNGATTYAVAANQGTYVGSIYMDGTAGQISCLLSYGQSRKWSVWNYYNRKRIVLRAGDGTASWTYATASYRASNNSTANAISTFVGVAEEPIVLDFLQNTTNTSLNASFNTGIGKNSTSALSGKGGSSASAVISSATSVPVSNVGARFIDPPSLGVNVYTALELGATNVTFLGTEANMLLTAEYEG